MNILIALFCILAAVTCELENACDETKLDESTCSKYLAAARPENTSEECSVVLQHIECLTDLISTSCGAEYATNFLKPQNFANVGVFDLQISELEAIPECRALVDFVGWRGREAGNSRRKFKQFKNESTPCPQAEWKSLMEAQITDGNTTASTNDIHAALSARYPGHPFLVKCSEHKVNEKYNTANLRQSVANRYCVVVKDNVMCMAVIVTRVQ